MYDIKRKYNLIVYFSKFKSNKNKLSKVLTLYYFV